MDDLITDGHEEFILASQLAQSEEQRKIDALERAAEAAGCSCACETDNPVECGSGCARLNYQVCGNCGGPVTVEGRTTKYAWCEGCGEAVTPVTREMEGRGDPMTKSQLSQDTPPTHSDISARLRSLADEMDNIAVAMDYYGGFAEWAQHGREIAGAGAIARQWADEIDAVTREGDEK
jgi:hypothetical protein